MVIPSWISTAALWVYGAAVVFLALYALHSLWLLVLFFVHRPPGHIAVPGRHEDADVPTVLVQLPVYNERLVVDRVISAAGRLRWPQDKFRIQVLDDSTDDSVLVAQRAVAQLVAAGFQATLLHRRDRVGFKAGALEAGLSVDADHPSGPAEFVAIFDADFVPNPDFLERAIPRLVRDCKLALIQGRWGHLNRNANALTRAQALGIDGHFGIEQGARAWSGLAMNFNGTCGVWRRTAILAAGGWHHDTLTEDMDLSYRAQLCGWRCEYDLQLAVPGEIPDTVSAWRAQQFRWAKGSIQTARKLLPRVMRSSFSVRAKIGAFFHMTHYAVHPLILISMLAAPLALPAIAQLSPWKTWVGAGLFLLGVSSPFLLYGCAQRVLYGRRGYKSLVDWPLIAALGTGIAVSNSIAVWQALRGNDSEFVRTPKQGNSLRRLYHAKSSSGIIELLCAGWAGFGVMLSVLSPRPGVGIILFVYASGFLGMALALFRERQQLLRTRPLSPWFLPVAGAACAIGTAYLAWLPGWRERPIPFALVACAIGAVSLYTAWRLAGRPWTRRATILAIAFGIAMRALALGVPASDDVNRYVLEGVQVRHGENPYVIAPAESSLTSLVSGQVIREINHPEWTAIYPLASVAVEAAATKVWTSPWVFKFVAMGSELVGMAILLWLMKRHGVHESWFLLALWNPVGPIFAAGEGHHDFLMATLAVTALAVVGTKLRAGTVVAGAIAILMKPFVALWGIALISTKKVSWRAGVATIAIVALAYIPFGDAGTQLFQSLVRFGTDMRFHGAIAPWIHALMERAMPAGMAGPATTSVLAIVFGALVVIILRSQRQLLTERRQRQTVDLATLRLCAHLYMALLICLPTLHPWYFAPLALLLPFTASWAIAAWLAFSPLYFLHGLAMKNGNWAEHPVVTFVSHVPFVVAFLIEMSGQRDAQPALAAALTSHGEAELSVAPVTGVSAS